MCQVLVWRISYFSVPCGVLVCRPSAVVVYVWLFCIFTCIHISKDYQWYSSVVSLYKGLTLAKSTAPIPSAFCRYSLAALYRDIIEW